MNETTPEKAANGYVAQCRERNVGIDPVELQRLTGWSRAQLSKFVQSLTLGDKKSEPLKR